MRRYFLLLGAFVIVFASCHVGRFFVYNFANITDYKKFSNRPLVAPSGNTFHFHKSDSVKAPKSITLNNKHTMDFARWLEKTKTIGFMVVRNDSVLYENYLNGYEEESIMTSFSMAKSVTSLLIGCAIDEGLIKSTDEYVGAYIPDFNEEGLKEIKIIHLLQMTSGIDFNESYYNPLGQAALYYYGRNLRKYVARMKSQGKPGGSFNYASGDTQVLGLVLEKALKGKKVTEYLQEKIWTPLGMEFDASWSIDKKKDGMEKTFCCLNARMRDYAKIGRLMLNKGEWDGRQIVSKTWIEQSTKVDTSDGSSWYYQHQWWLPSKEGDFMAQGILGQFMYVNPAKNLIILRLGKNYGHTDWYSFLPALAKSY
jgi:CubicO group peptidase (beta-lactamase class C family)